MTKLFQGADTGEHGTCSEVSRREDKNTPRESESRPTRPCRQSEHSPFRGVFTAIITPFLDNGEIDWESFDKLVERQVSAGVSGIVPCGTTGESPTLSGEEQNEVIKRTVSLVNKRCQVIAGTGSNCTRTSIAKTKFAEELGVDACMVVNPYYNKPTQEGLYLHFSEVANAVSVPIVVYNIMGRTGVNIETETLTRLINDCGNILAVKEASGNLDQISDVIAASPDNFSVLSGDDDLTLELIKRGGDGIISVAANLVPEQMVSMVSKALAGDIEAALKEEQALKPLFEAQFIETNPIPIKAALAMKGLCQEEYRLPMCELTDENRIILEKTINAVLPKN